MIDLDQIAAWYRDPVRVLPRKILADIDALAAEVARLRASLIESGVMWANEKARAERAERDCCHEVSKCSH